MLRKYQITVFLLLILYLPISFAWSDDWDYRGSGRDYAYSQRIDDYYALGYVPRPYPIDLINFNALSFAPVPLPPPGPEPNEFTVTFPDGHGGIINVVIKKSGDGFVGPKGEYYPEFPKPWQLRMKYGN